MSRRKGNMIGLKSGKNDRRMSYDWCEG